MEIKNLEKKDLDRVIEILHQDSLRYCDGDYPGIGWTSDFIDNEKAFAFGLWENNILNTVLFAEKLVHNGCILWMIATDIQKQGNGYGSELLKYFENYLKQIEIKWIFLNSTENSINFYKKHNYITSSHSKVYEHVKDL